MPWWSWLIIWSCLVFALIVVLAVAAKRLFHKASAVFDELGTLAAQVDLLDAAESSFDEPQAGIAILKELSDVQATGRGVREAAAARRDARRSARLARGRDLTGFDANSRQWFQKE